MTIVLAPDSFKESLTAKEVCDAMEAGIHRANPHINCIKVPMADGGEGTMQSLVDATNGNIYSVKVSDPLGRTVNAEYGILGGGEVAVFEMAAASGLHLVSKDERNPLKTSTFGTGQIIAACLNHPIKKLLIGIGGSATNDGGAGMIQALGAKLMDKNGNNLEPGGGSLDKLDIIDLSALDKRLKNIDIEVACDVSNPIVGKEGASYIFGPQKGASESMVRILDSNLSHFSSIVEKNLGINIKNLQGGGAAGGLGAGLSVFLNATLKSGIKMVMEYTGLEKQLKKADMVWTGEGSLDSQTIYGKTPFGVAKSAKKFNLPVIALAGSLGSGSEILYDHGFDALFSVLNQVETLPSALANGRRNIQRTSENIMRLISLIPFYKN